MTQPKRKTVARAAFSLLHWRSSLILRIKNLESQTFHGASAMSFSLQCAEIYSHLWRVNRACKRLPMKLEKYSVNHSNDSDRNFILELKKSSQQFKATKFLQLKTCGFKLNLQSPLNCEPNQWNAFDNYRRHRSNDDNRFQDLSHPSSRS